MLIWAWLKMAVGVASRQWCAQQ